MNRSPLRSQATGLARAAADTMPSIGDAALQKSLEDLGSAIATRHRNNVIQLPLWHEFERGTPNSFLRSALFSAIQSKDRQFLKEIVLASSKDVTIKLTW